jgi:hypothetical protein
LIDAKSPFSSKNASVDIAIFAIKILGDEYKFCLFSLINGELVGK